MQARGQSYGCCKASHLWACPIWSWLTSQLSCFISVSSPSSASFFSFQKVGAWSHVCSERAPWPTRLPLTFSLINKTTNWSFLILGTLVIKSLLRWNETLNFMSRRHEHISRRGRETGSISAMKYTTLFLSLTVCSAILCVIFETCRTSLLVLYSHIFPNIPEQREPQVPFNAFFPTTHTSPFGDSPFFTLLCRDDWLRISGKPVARSSCLPNIFSGVQSEEKLLTKTPRKRISYLCTPGGVHMRWGQDANVLMTMLLRKTCFNTQTSLTQWEMQKLPHAQCRWELVFIRACWRSLRQSLVWHGQRVQGRNSLHCHILHVSSPISQRQAFRLPHPACASSRQCSRH